MALKKETIREAKEVTYGGLKVVFRTLIEGGSGARKSRGTSHRQKISHITGITTYLDNA